MESKLYDTTSHVSKSNLLWLKLDIASVIHAVIPLLTAKLTTTAARHCGLYSVLVVVKH